METEFLSSINWGLNTDPTEPPFPWETISPGLGQDEAWMDPQLQLLLSASSYPIPEQQEPEHQDPAPLFGGLLLHQDDTASGNPSISGSQPTEEATAVSTVSPPKHRVSKTAGEPVRKRGRPRKLTDDVGITPEERRRRQVRIAQQAYRSRKEANISSLKDRINQLETTVKQMGTAVINFGDDIVRSGALGSHPELLKPLGNTVQACLALPALPHGGPNYQLELPDSTSAKKNNKQIGYLSSSSNGSANLMDISEFIDRLHVICSYQAYLVCANPAVPIRQIERPFRILFTLFPRAVAADYFKDWLLARAGHRTLDHWDQVPFFRIGGAGTHYPVSEDAFLRHQFPFPPHQGLSKAEECLSRFTPDVQEELEDEWFDLGDLQGYLHERQVVFPASARTIGACGPFQKDQTIPGVSRLIKMLVSRAVCLGRSPGFRRRDVVTAVDVFLASQSVPES